MNSCTEDQVITLEAIYDEIDLDGLQESVINAVGGYWADDINIAIADMDFEFRKAIRGMSEEAVER